MVAAPVSGVSVTTAGPARRALSATVMLAVRPARAVTATTARASVSPAGTANTARSVRSDPLLDSRCPLLLTL